MGDGRVRPRTMRRALSALLMLLAAGMGAYAETGGLGIHITFGNGLVIVTDIREGSPASRADLKPGDIITHVDKSSLGNLTLEQAAEKMRGPANTAVTLTIKREGSAEPRDVTIVREVLPQPAADPSTATDPNAAAQPGSAPSPQSGAPSSASSTVTASGVRQTLEKLGLIGRWSLQCAKPDEAENELIIYKIEGDRLEQDVTTGWERQSGTVEQAVEISPNELLLTSVWNTRQEATIRVDGDRRRIMELSRNSSKIVEAGVYTSNAGQTKAETASATRCQELPPPDVAAATGSLRQIMEKYGALGAWAVNCQQPPSASNPYSVYRAVDDRFVQFDSMSHPTQSSMTYILDSAAEDGPNQLSVVSTAQYRDVLRLQIEGERLRVLELVRNGIKFISDGRYNVTGFAKSAEQGKDTQYFEKCR